MLRAGEVRARELVEASLDAIERLNPAVNAFVVVCGERAVAEADGVRVGDERPLCGVPVGIKDLLSATEACRRPRVAGQPAISLPLARTTDGLPIGVQLVAAPDRDDVLISLAAQLEAAANWPTCCPAVA